MPHVSLQAIRENLDLTQAAMGERVGRNAGRGPLHFTTISRFERGSRGIDSSLLEHVARAYGIRAGDIVWIDTPAAEQETPEDSEDEEDERAA